MSQTDRFTTALNDCIDLLNRGMPLERCLAQYPDLAAELRPLLAAGLRVRQERAGAPVVAAARERVRARVTDAMRQAPAPRRRWQSWPALALVASLVLVFVVTLSGVLEPLLPALQQPTLTATLAATSTEPVSTVTATLTVTVTATLSPTATGTPPPSPTPAATGSAQACAPVQPEGWVAYSVRTGDTLSGLAAAGATTIDRIVQANCLPASTLIVVGQALYVPAETLSGLPAGQTPVPAGSAPSGTNDNADDDNDNDAADDNSGSSGNDNRNDNSNDNNDD